MVPRVATGGHLYVKRTLMAHVELSHRGKGAAKLARRRSSRGDEGTVRKINGRFMLSSPALMGGATPPVILSLPAVGHGGGSTVTVQQNAQRIKPPGEGSRMVIHPPKKQAGYRDVPIFPVDGPIFLDYLDRYTPQLATTVHTPTGSRRVKLFTATEKGGILFDTSYRERLRYAKTAIGTYIAINPHMGRNWLITRLAEQGVFPKGIG